MPFTPFHLGPGAVFKVVGGDRFSFMVFGGSQVLIDLEPALRLMTGECHPPRIHTYSYWSASYRDARRSDRQTH